MKNNAVYFVFCFLATCFFLSPGFAQQEEVITTGKLFREMIDMNGLTKFPAPYYKTVQYSSYDRRSKVPGGPFWFSNSDGFGREPIPNFEKVLREPDEKGIGEYLIADIKGPGAIVRLWSAAISGNIMLFLDDQKNPLYDGPAIDFFHNTYDDFPQINSINKELFGSTIYQRDASYTPIAFAKRMRMIWKGDLNTIHFYQVGVRRYEPQTKVITFSLEDLSTYRFTIDKVTAVLSDPDKLYSVNSIDPEVRLKVTLMPFEKKGILTLQGPKAIERLTFKIEADNINKALRQTILHIHCDSYPWGHVQSPIGDFFGAAPGINPYTSLPFSVQEDRTMICRFVMPFKDSMKIFLENQGDQTISITASAFPKTYNWDKNRSMYFRARWRVDHNLIASNKDVQDLPFLAGNGKGVYVGTASFLLNPSPIPTPYGSWWGEGDEKIFIDDETFPSTFGTGSEDYYNYSWSSPDIFYFPYCGQPRNDGPGNRGFVTNFRWHILDTLPFHNNIRFYMELYSHERISGLSYARIGYHYARPGMMDDHKALMPDDVRFPQLLEKWFPAARMGAINSVFYAAENNITEKKNTTVEPAQLWAGGKCLVWTPDNPGDKKIFIFDVEKAGKKRIHIVLGLTPCSGKVSFQIDGKPVFLSNDLKKIDLYRPFRTLLRNFSFQNMDLSSGRHELTVVFEGNEHNIQGSKISIDFFWVQDR